MQVFDLFNTKYEQDLKEGAVDRLEQRRIDDLNMKMDDLVARAKQAVAPEHKAALKREFAKVKSERDSYYQVKKVNEGSMKRWLESQALRLSKERFVADAGEYGMSDKEAAEFWDNINGVEESGIGHDIADKAEKLARATPPTKAGAVASTVKNAAKWLAGKGGPGKEGPTYEGAEDIEDRGEYDQEGDMVKDNLHTIRREAEELERILSDNENVPEWVQDKLAQVKGMITSASEYMQTQRERDHEEHTSEEGVTMAEWKKEGEWKEIPKSKTGKPVDPRGEVTHLSDVARRETLRKLAQKKNSEKVAEESKQDLAAALMLKKAHAAFPLAKDDAEALALWIADKEQRDVNRLERENEHEEEMIARIADQLKSKEVDEGWSDRIVAQRTGKPRTPYSVYIKGKKWKDFENEDHAEAVANKLRAKFKAEGRDPSVITIAPTDYDKGVDEAANPAQQAAIAIAMKKAHKKPKHVDEAGTAGLEDTIRRLMAPAYEEETGGMFSYTLEKKAPTMARLRKEYSDDLNDIFYNATPEELHQAAQELKDMYGQVEEAQAGDVNFGHTVTPGGWIVYDPETKQIRKRFKTHTAGKSYAKTHGLGFASSEYYFDNIKPAVTAEGMTDYQKRRQRERDVDAGRPVAKQRTPKQTDYQKRRAEQKRQDELGEEKTRLDPKCWKGKKIGNPKTKMKGGVRVNNCVPAESVAEDIYMENEPSPVESAIIRRIMVAHKDWLIKFGPQKVMQAAEEVAYDVGDVDEIGTSDVSAYVHQVGRILGA